MITTSPLLDVVTQTSLEPHSNLTNLSDFRALIQVAIPACQNLPYGHFLPF